MASIISKKIAKEDFDMLLSALNRYKILTNEQNFEPLINKLNIYWVRKDFRLLTKDEARRIVIILDLVSVMRPTEDFKGYDISLENLYQRLNKNFLRLYNEGIYII